MAATVQMMFDNALGYLKGWFSPTALDYEPTKLSPNVTVDPVPGGRCLHLEDESGLFALGCKAHRMPIFGHQGSNANDVANPGPASSAHTWYAIAPTGVMSGLVATGAYELATTEYHKGDGVTYKCNDKLHAPTEDQITGDDKTAAGKLHNRKYWPGGGNGALTPGTDQICGLVSRGILAPEYNNRVLQLAFWPVHWYGTEV